jgi:hypothetical protein
MVPVEEAEARAGFRPVFPPRELVGDAPARVMVTGPMTARQTVDVVALREALAKVGAHDVDVPEVWQGVTLRLEMAPMVIAGYADEVQVIQSKPFAFETPAGFPLAKFAEAAFRCAGVPAGPARAMAEKYAANPAWLLDVPEDEVAQVEEILMGARSGLLVEEPVETGGWRVTVLFGTAERVFAVVSNSRGRSLAIANSLR